MFRFYTGMLCVSQLQHRISKKYNAIDCTCWTDWTMSFLYNTFSLMSRCNERLITALCRTTWLRALLHLFTERKKKPKNQPELTGWFWSSRIPAQGLSAHSYSLRLASSVFANSPRSNKVSIHCNWPCHSAQCHRRTSVDQAAGNRPSEAVALN